MDRTHYILRDQKIVAVGLEEWAHWFENGDRKVARTDIGEATVSTVFLGLNHNYGEGEPLLFETMVFGGNHDGDAERYATWDEAVSGHNEMVARLQST